jgi:rootletin
VKLQSSKEQLILFKKQCENAEDGQQTLEVKVGELTEQLDSCRSHCSQLVQEKDLLQKSLDSVRSEKNALDKNRMEINAMVSTWRLVI